LSGEWCHDLNEAQQACIKVLHESRSNQPAVQIPDMEQLAKEELGVNHKQNMTQDWLAVTEEAKLRLGYINGI